MTTRLKRTIRNCDEDANFDEKNGYSNSTHALKIRAGTCFTPDSNLCSVHPGLQIIPSCTLHQNPFNFLFFLLPLPQSIPRPRPPPYWVSHHRLQLSWVSLFSSECLCLPLRLALTWLLPHSSGWSTLLSRLHTLHWWWWLWRIASIFPLGGIMKSIIFIAFMERW